MSRPPRILHLTRDFPPRSAGGISTAVGGLVGAARDAGLLHAVVSFDGWRPTRAAAEHIALPGDAARGVLQRVGGPGDLATARRAVAAFAPDAVHVHHSLLFELAAEVAPNVPRLFTAHVLQRRLSALRGLGAPTLSDAAERTALEDADGISVPTEAARQLLGDPRAIVTRLGTRIIDSVSVIDHQKPDTMSINVELPPRLLVLSRFDALKGTADVIDALADLLALGPDLELTIAGGIPENAKADRRWRRRFEAAGCPGPRTRLFPWLGPDAVEAILRESTHFLAPSHAETCGLGLLEARAAGLALIAADLPSHREIAPDATFFSAGDPAALVNAVRVALAGPPAPPPIPVVPTLRWQEVLPDWVHFWRVWG